MNELDRAAERSVLAACLVSDAARWDVLDVVKPSHFWSAQNQQVMAAIANLAENGEPSTPATVGELLREQGKLDSSGGITYLFDLLTDLPDVSHASHHAEMVLDAAVRRSLGELGRALMEGAGASAPAKELLDSARRRLLEIDDGQDSQAVHISTPAMSVVANAIAIANGDAGMAGLLTGITGLDRIVPGLRPGNVYVIAGATGSGKTTLGMQIAEHVAGNGSSVWVNSIEMSAEQLASRTISRRTSISMKEIECGRVTPYSQGLILESANGLESMDLLIDARSKVSPSDILASVRRQAMKRHVDLLVVDHLGILDLSARPRGMSRPQEVGLLCRQVKQIAGQLEIPVILMVQLSRRHEHEKREPDLRDLRDSGEIEQHAFAVVMIHPNKESSAAELIVRKHRQGPTGRVMTKFEGMYSRFVEVGMGEQ